jgi:hypothetical protein
MRFPNYELSEYQARHNPKAKARLGAATLELMSLGQVLALATPEQRGEWQHLLSTMFQTAVAPNCALRLQQITKA